MKIKVIASTKVGYVLPKEEAVDFSGKSAGICYLPDTVETLFAEAPEKNTKKSKWELRIRSSQCFWPRTLQPYFRGNTKNSCNDFKQREDIQYF